MSGERFVIYPSTKAYTQADGTVVRHVSNRKYTRKLPKCTEADLKKIDERHKAGERLSIIGKDYQMTYARTWAMMKRWREEQDGIHPVPNAIAVPITAIDTLQVVVVVRESDSSDGHVEPDVRSSPRTADPDLPAIESLALS